MSETLQLTQALISRQSVSPADGGCQALMIERLAAVGFSVESLRFGPVDNFWAKRGNGGPVFCFAGGNSSVIPSGTDHANSPVFAFTAISRPHGGF